MTIPRSGTLTRRIVRGLAALITLATLLLAAPLALAWWGNPWPAGGWSEIQLLTNRTIIGALVAVGWLAWLQMTACILIEAIAMVRGTTASRVRFAPASQQAFVRLLIVASLGIGAGAVANGTSVAAAPAESGRPTLIGETAHHEHAADRLPSTTLNTDMTLWRLAENHLGDGLRWREILDLNSGVLASGTQTIPAGTTVRLPGDARQLSFTPTADTEEVVAHDGSGDEEPLSAATRIVEPGDTLWDMAHDELGDPYRYEELFEASKDTLQPGGEYLSDPDLIKPGWTITIPVDEEVEQPAPDALDHSTPETEEKAPNHPAEKPLPQNRVVPENVDVDRGEQADDADGNVLGMSWVLSGLTGAGVLLAAGLSIGLRQRRRAQVRARRPGRAISTPDAELAPVEKTIRAAGETGEEALAFVDAALRRLAGTIRLSGGTMPPVAAVEMQMGAAGCLTVHLSEAADFPSPWQGTPDRLHWHIPTCTDFDDIGPLSDEVDPPYPLLVTIGHADTGELWLLNCEEAGVLTIIGDSQRGRDFARHLVAQLAVNPWSHNATVDCVGIAGEATTLGESIHYHEPGDETHAAIAEAIADAVATVDRATGHNIDASTGRTGRVDGDLWPSRLLLLDPITTGMSAPQLEELIGLVTEQVGRTATAVLLLGKQTDARGMELSLTSAGRVVLAQAGLDLTAVGLTSEETTGIGMVYSQSENLDGTEVPVDTTVDSGWETYADYSGALRREHTIERTTQQADAAETTTSLLDGDDANYLATATVLPEDLEGLAPNVPAELRAEVEDHDPTLDDDYADWLAEDGNRARLTLLGPVAARTHGKALAKRRAYFTELLAFLWFHRRNGATRDQIVDAFGTPPDRVRKDGSILRDWLGTDPRTGQPYLPPADQAPAARATGVNVYQLVDQGVLVDWDLFKRLRLRGEARGGADGRSDLLRALKLVTGRPCDRLRPGGWSWLADGERHDHYMAAAIADVALTIATHFLRDNDTTGAREATEIALLAAPDEEATRLSLVQITRAEGNPAEAERILRDDVCNRSDDGHAPTDLNDRTQALLRQQMA